MTFDAFAKGLVDRFGQVLPERWRPRPDYEIMWTNYDLFADFLQRQVGAPPPEIGAMANIQAITVKAFERYHLVGRPLPVDGWPKPTPAQWAADRFWQSSLHEGEKTRLSFPMIGRLAELLLRLNPMARDALRLTYSHLFMDEFQDTTQVQYDLVKTIFMGTNTVVTAVGDNKQQIMRWAMAMSAVLAALDVAAEGSRAAGLDRRHDLELGKADVPGLVRPPRWAVTAEDVGDRARCARRSAAKTGPLPDWNADLRGDLVERAGHGAHDLGGHAGVERGVFQLGVS